VRIGAVAVGVDDHELLGADLDAQRGEVAVDPRAVLALVELQLDVERLGLLAFALDRDGDDLALAGQRANLAVVLGVELQRALLVDLRGHDDAAERQTVADGTVEVAEQLRLVGRRRVLGRDPDRQALLVVEGRERERQQDQGESHSDFTFEIRLESSALKWSVLIRAPSASSAETKSFFSLSAGLVFWKLATPRLSLAIVSASWNQASASVPLNGLRSSSRTFFRAPPSGSLSASVTALCARSSRAPAS